MGALFGGRLPQPPAYVPGGFTTTPRPERIRQFKEYLGGITSFIRNVYIPDVHAVAGIYDEYFEIGSGHRNLLAYGVFDLDDAGSSKLLARGRIRAGGSAVEGINTTSITENITHGWYSNQNNNLTPSSGVTNPVFPKPGAYSWLKAPRYDGLPYEVGPLARMRASGLYQGGVSVMDRHLSRAEEALRVAVAMADWVDEIQPSQPVYRQYSVPASGSGVGLTEAPRGALGHWIKIVSEKTANYQIVTPTCWNASPRDSRNALGPIEAALVGTPVENPDAPVEVLRVIHSFDPCLSCAVHVVRPGADARRQVVAMPV
jgi:hydrogenase large subunit